MLGPFKEHALIAIRCGWRRHSFRVIFLCGCLLIGGAYLAATFSARQPATTALDVGLSGIRAVTTMLCLFWVQDLLGRDIDRKNLLWVLAFPAPRSAYLLGRYIGIMTLCALAVLLLGGLLAAIVANPGIGYTPTTRLTLGLPYLLTLAYIVLDIWLITAFAVLVCMLSTTSIMPLFAGAIFAICARSLGGIISYLKSGEAAGLHTANFKAIDIIASIIPDLSRLDIRDICLYQSHINTNQLFTSATMAISYTALLLTLAAWRLNTREFS